ncbi:MAG: hypothetical protein HY674_07965 [Chloroflexi bacterium]|nr:hypothetical protein [Chloroflexota bacterium]
MDDTPATLVCFAVKEEAACFSNPPAGCKVLITGIGPRNAAARLTAALAAFHPSLVLSCGFAGGLNPQLQLGAVLFAAEEESRLTYDLAKLGARPARFYCADRVAVSASEKHRLWLETQADAVEMESGALHQICRERQIPCATIRVISDAAQEDLPLDFNLLLKSDLTMDYAKLAWTLLAAPGRIPSLLRFRRRTRLAARNLADVLRRLPALSARERGAL